jgi:phosphoribosylglycinamide formyltransferase-1
MAETVNRLLPIVVLISGRGSNLGSIMDACATGRLPVEIRAVICNRPDAPGLQRPASAGIRTVVIDHTRYTGRAAFDRALQASIDSFRPGLLVLAGFMRILTPEFVAHYRGRILNIHPSLLPEFPGLNTHQRALAAGSKQAGATIHFVTGAVDGGPAVLQARVPVLENDSAATLAERVLEQEHRLYPLAIRWFAEGRLSLDEDGRVVLDGRQLQRPLLLATESDTCT